MNERPYPQFMVCAFDIVTFALFRTLFSIVLSSLSGVAGPNMLYCQYDGDVSAVNGCSCFFFTRSVSEWHSPGRKKHTVIQGSTLVPLKNRHDSSMDCNTVLRKFWCTSCSCRVPVVLGGFVSRWATHGFTSLTALVYRGY